jgi:hypothetical protein
MMRMTAVTIEEFTAIVMLANRCASIALASAGEGDDPLVGKAGYGAPHLRKLSDSAAGKGRVDAQILRTH